MYTFLLVFFKQYFRLCFVSCFFVVKVYYENMKKILIWIWYIFSALIITSTVGLAIIMFAKPHVLQDIIVRMMRMVEFLGWKNYLLASWVTILESIPFINMAIPGQTFMVIIAWFVAQFNYIGIVLIVAISSIIGDSIAYYLGRKQGETILGLYGPTFWLNEDRVKKIKDAMKDHSHWAIFASKWNAYTRGILPFIAWSAHTNFWEFMLYNMLWSLAYSLVLVTLAKMFVGHYQVVAPYIRWIGLWVVWVAAIWYIYTHIRDARKTR